MGFRRCFTPKKLFRWGHGEWKLDWSDDDEKNWTEEHIKAFGATFANDGMFFMTLDDFMKYFYVLYVCFTHSRKGIRFTDARFSIKATEKKHYIGYTFTLSKKKEIIASVHQQDEENVGAPKLTTLSVALLKQDGDYIKGKKKHSRSFHVRRILEEGKYWVVAGTTKCRLRKSELKECPFTLVVHSEGKVRIKSEPIPKSVLCTIDDKL